MQFNPITPEGPDVLHAPAVLLGGACAWGVCLFGGYSPATRCVKPVCNFPYIFVYPL